jgi:hypothetical protein
MYEEFSNRGIQPPVVESAIITLHGTGKIVIDGETVMKA